MSSQKNRVSSGVEQLDRLLGGLFIGDNVIWYDDAGSLASVFCLNFIRESRERNRPVIYVSFDRSPKSLISTLGPLAEGQNITVIDCFTHGKGDGSDIFSKFYEKDGVQWPYQIIRINEPWKPERLTDAITHLHKGLKDDVRFVFESLTGMQDVWGGEEDSILKFYSRTCPRLYELETIAYWIVEKGAHSSRLRARINQIAQVAVDLALKSGRSSLTILKADKRTTDNINRPVPFQSDGMEIAFEIEKKSRDKIDIGSRLKALRAKQGISQRELASQVGVTPSTISQVESGLIYPSLQALFKMAEVLGVAPASLLQNEDEPERRSVFSEAGHDVPFSDLPKGHIQGRSLLPVDMSANVEPFIIEIPPGKRVPAHFFAHKGEEFGYLLEGKLTTTIRNVDHPISAGDVVYLTRDYPTRWENVGTDTVRLLWLKLK